MENTKSKFSAEILIGILVLAAVVIMIVVKSSEISKETMIMRQEGTTTK